MDLMFRNLFFCSTPAVTHSNANPRILQYQGFIPQVCSSPNQTDSDVTFSSSCDQGKIKKNGLKSNYGRLNDYLNQISKLSYVSLLDLADFLMHH